MMRKCTLQNLCQPVLKDAPRELVLQQIDVMQCDFVSKLHTNILHFEDAPRELVLQQIDVMQRDLCTQASYKHT